MKLLTGSEVLGTKEAGDHHRNNLDILRLTFALAVMLSHSYPLVTGNPDDEPLLVRSRFHTTLGGLSVGFFFVISGFLITRSYLSTGNTKKFLVKRALRIFPGYLVATALSVALVAPFVWSGMTASSFFGLIAKGLAMDPLESPGIFWRNPMPGSVNGSLWTIRYEFCCYLFVILLGRAGVLRRPRLMLAVFVGIFACSFIARLSPEFRTRYFLFGQFNVWCRFFLVFVAGMNLFLWRNFIPVKGAYAVLAIATSVLSIYARPAELVNLILVVSLAYVIYWLAFTPLIRLHDFGKYGDYSYGTYLYAWPVQQLLIWSFGPKLSPLGVFAMAVPITLVFAVASWFLVERPFLRMKPRSTVTLTDGIPNSLG